MRRRRLPTPSLPSTNDRAAGATAFPWPRAKYALQAIGHAIRQRDGLPCELPWMVFGNDRTAAVSLRDRSYRFRQHQVQLVLIHIDLRGTLWTFTIGVDGAKRPPDRGKAAARLSNRRAHRDHRDSLVGFFGGYPKREKTSPASLRFLSVSCPKIVRVRPATSRLDIFFQSQ
jgi:hypothetical protein